MTLLIGLVSLINIFNTTTKTKLNLTRTNLRGPSTHILTFDNLMNYVIFKKEINTQNIL